MDFAANAVLDTIAPPTRQAPTRDAAAAPDDGPSFNDHLDAATRESETAPNAEPKRPEQAPEKSATGDTTNAADSLLGGEMAPLAPTAPQAVAEQTTAPVFVQLIAESAAPVQHAEPQHQAAIANAAPSAPPPPAPKQAGANTQDAPVSAPIDAATTPASKAATPKNDASAEKSAAPTAALTQTATSSAQPQTATPLAQPQTAPTIPAPVPAALTPQTEESAGTAALIAPAPVQTQPDQAARQPKAAPVQGETKTETPPAPDRAAATPTAPPRASAKAATPQATAAKESGAFVSLVDAPESAAPQQASSAPAGATSSTHTQHTAAEQSGARVAPAAHQVAREIVRKFDGGNTRFELRLDPPELGRVEVRMEVSRDHRVTAVIAADTPQALTELARHARDLEQMLQGAGLELSDSGLSFDLRQRGERAETAEFSGSISDGAPPVEGAIPVAARPIGYERWRGVRVDMMV